LPSLLSVPACSVDVADEKAYMSDVETALQEYTIIFNGIIR
jgi:pantothenate kinase-related protein Tda10